MASDSKDKKRPGPPLDFTFERRNPRPVKYPITLDANPLPPEKGDAGSPQPTTKKK